MIANPDISEETASPSSPAIRSLTIWTALISTIVFVGFMLAPREPAAQQQTGAAPITSVSVTPNGDVVGSDFQVSGEPVTRDTSDVSEMAVPKAHSPVGID